MRLIRRLFGGAEARGSVDRANPKDPAIAEIFGAATDMPAVTPQTALGIPAVYACVNVLAESVASLPVGVWRVAGENRDERQEATDHPLHNLLTGRPCEHMTGVEWVEWLVTNTALRGDAFVRITTDFRGQVTNLQPLPWAQVTPEMRDDASMRYRLHHSRGRRTEVLQSDEVFRLPWKIQEDGLSISPIGVMRETFALALQSRRYQTRLLGNNAAPKGGIKLPNGISDEAAEALISSWERRHKGADNAGRMAVFDGGMEWVKIGMSNDDAQFAELMQLTLRDVARTFRVQPHKIGDLANATFSNIEHQSIEFVTDTLLPWVRKIEARAEGWLLTRAERPQLNVEFNLRGLLRGDAKARSELYRVLFYAGAINRNEIRRMEGLNPVADGDRFYVQSATIPVDLIDRVALGDTPRSDDPLPA